MNASHAQRPLTLDPPQARKAQRLSAWPGSTEEWPLRLWRHLLPALQGWSLQTEGELRLVPATTPDEAAQWAIVSLGAPGTRLNLGPVDRLLPERPDWWQSPWREALLLQALAPVLSALAREGLVQGGWQVEWPAASKPARFRWPMALQGRGGFTALELAWDAWPAAAAALAQHRLQAGEMAADEPAPGDATAWVRPVLATLPLSAQEFQGLRTGGGLLLHSAVERSHDLAVQLGGTWLRLGRAFCTGGADAMSEGSAKPDAPDHTAASGWQVVSLAIKLLDPQAELQPLLPGDRDVAVLGPGWPLSLPDLLMLQPQRALPPARAGHLICAGSGQEGPARLIDWRLGRVAQLVQWGT